MDKRTLLAFALSFLVLIGWSLLFGPKQVQRTNQEEASNSSRPVKAVKAALPQALEKTAGRITPTNRIIPKADEQEIEIDTPLYKAVFSNAGPGIKSFKLKRYHQGIDQTSPLVDLVGPKRDTGDYLFIDFGNPSPTQGEKIIYQVDHQKIQLGPRSSPQDLVFQSMSKNGLSTTQTFRFYPDQYRIDLKIDVANQSNLPVNGVFAAHLKALPSSKKKSYYSYVGLVLLMDKKLKELKIKKPPAEKSIKGQIDWVAYEDDYFISAVIPEEPANGVLEGRLSPSGILEGTYLPASMTIDASNQVSSKYTLYLGPRDLTILKQFGKNLDKAVNFGWFDIFAKPLLHALRFSNEYINNYGVSIILLTILIKIIFWPLTHKSYKSMKEMQKLQPRLAKIREKYKDDKQQLNKEMMALYRTYKVNPMGGCLPMIIQIPVFFALYRILGTAIELRHAPFVLWINDLSAPDRLFVLPFKVPFMSPPYGIPVLTLLMGVSMFVQQKMTPTPGDPTQAKMMMFLPIIFTFMFINFPSGLVLYWLVNNVLSIGQQYRIYKKPA